MWVEERIKYCLVYCGPERCDCLQMVWYPDEINYKPIEEKEENNENRNNK